MDGCTHPLVSIVPYRHILVWISLHGLLTLPWKVPVIPHGHVFSRVSLHKVLTVLLIRATVG